MRVLVRTALRAEGGFDVVGEAGDGAQAVAMAEALRPDIVVLDLGLPDIAGHEVITRIRATSPASKVVVFSGTDDPDSWIAENVEGYVAKDAEIAYLVQLLGSLEQREREATLELSQSPTSVRAARQFATEVLAQWRLDSLIDDALLVVSELATNAVTHASSSCRLRLAHRPSTLRIDVLDTGAGTPDPRAATSSDENGRGLLIVDALAAAWGLEQVPGRGKLVWAELAFRPAAAN